MRLVPRQWCNAGRPRECLKVSYRQYKAAKCDFRRLHRKVVFEYLKSLNDDIDVVQKYTLAGFGNLLMRDEKEIGQISELELNSTMR